MSPWTDSSHHHPRPSPPGFNKSRFPRAPFVGRSFGHRIQVPPIGRKKGEGIVVSAIEYVWTTTVGSNKVPPNIFDDLSDYVPKNGGQQSQSAGSSSVAVCMNVGGCSAIQPSTAGLYSIGFKISHPCLPRDLHYKSTVKSFYCGLQKAFCWDFGY